jgi:hypothetical protein
LPAQSKKTIVDNYVDNPVENAGITRRLCTLYGNGRQFWGYQQVYSGILKKFSTDFERKKI